MNKPLAERMRPISLTDFCGQEHLLGKNGVLRTSLESGIIPSMILWGPPGVGKTTLARIMVHTLNKPFYSLSAINSGVREIREIIDKVRTETLLDTGDAVLFIDEIHRFSKSQQDSLLGAVEEGVITLIGATTENPSFEVISPLLSRCQVYTLNPLDEHHLLTMLQRAIASDEVLAAREIEIAEIDSLLQLSGGDARKLLNILELLINAQATGKIVITNELVQKQAQKYIARYDKDGDQHYDLISAFIKSIRGSDPNAAVYYLARIIEGGEDPLFIARRLVILAAEDIGNANPQGLVVANSCFQAVNVIGMPEGRIILSQCATYLACSPKSNASYKAINDAQAAVKKTGSLTVPLHLRNAPTDLMRKLGHGEGYQYAHHYEDNFAELEFLPDAISGTTFYQPGDSRWETAAREFLRERWRKKYGY